MKVHLRFLRHSRQILEALHKDGWQLRPEKAESLSAQHPEVPDEKAARCRLHRLGLLTSPSLFINFEPVQNIE
jgi:hypothetical protein